MAVTEITKILFRRGTELDRRELEQFGGLAQGEPGFTSSEGGTQTDGYNPKSAFLQEEDAVTWDATNGGGDFFIGGKSGKDIYIGGASMERHLSRYFLPLSGTGYAHGWTGSTDDQNYINGNLHVGVAGNTDNMTSKGINSYSVKLYGSTNINNYQKVVEWNPQYGVFEVDSETALRLPCGATNQRPNTPGDYQGYTTVSTSTGLTGMMRFNTETTSFEGHNGTNWVGVGGAMSIDRLTYISFENPIANTTACSGMSGQDEVITFVTDCVSAGSFDQNGNLTARSNITAGSDITAGGNIYAGSDIVAFYTSDERLKDNIYVIDNPLRKIEKIRGVEFDWKESGPTWVDEENRHDIGLIAQDVEQIIPEAVETRGDGTKAVNYYKVIPLLLEGIKELSNKIISLEKKLK